MGTSRGAPAAGHDPSRHWPLALIIVAGFTALRAALAAQLPVISSEAYYWLWSRELAWGYYDHPPIVALVMRLGSPWLDYSPLGVRLGHLLLSALGSLLFYALCLRLVRPRAALACLVVLGFAPLWLPFGVLGTPDGPLLFFWVLALFLFHHAWSRDRLGLWLAAGASTGLTILSKYNGFLLLPTFFGILLLSARGRRQLLSPRPYLALLIALLVFAPNLIWNAQHGGETATTPFRDGIELGNAFKHLGQCLLLPFVHLTPLLGVAWMVQSVVGVRRGRLWDDEAFQFAFCASWLPFAAFAAVSIFTQVHAHWVASCFVAALPLALENLGRAGAGTSPRFLRTSMAAGGALVVAVFATALIGMSLAEPPPSGKKPRGFAKLAVEARGWQELRERIHREVADRRGERPVFLMSMNYHLVSHMEWLTGGRYPALPLDPYHSHQYLYWQSAAELLGADALYVDKRHKPSEDRDLRRAFASVEPLEPLWITVGGERMKRFDLFWCRGFRGRPE
jgi:dolichol-phosphate mannosyltransferase